MSASMAKQESNGVAQNRRDRFVRVSSLIFRKGGELSQDQKKRESLKKKVVGQLRRTLSNRSLRKIKTSSSSKSMILLQEPTTLLIDEVPQRTLSSDDSTSTESLSDTETRCEMDLSTDVASNEVASNEVASNDIPVVKIEEANVEKVPSKRKPRVLSKTTLASILVSIISFLILAALIAITKTPYASEFTVASVKEYMDVAQLQNINWSNFASKISFGKV